MMLTSDVLENRHVRLEPFADVHRDGLREACDADPATWNELYPFSMLGESFEVHWARLLREREKGQTLPFAVVAGGRCCGMTTLMAIDELNRSVEIGGTYYHPAVRGGAVNPSAKRLLLGHAFERGARRVQFMVDAINARSRAAVLKLGAREEGLLRKHRSVWTGRVRDSVIFSIVDDEWPGVCARLDARIAAFDREPAV
jgi:RimJ/RimL family protein N-acetyltransferase